MDSWQQILAAYPLLQTIWDALYVSVPLASLLAFSGIYFLASILKILAQTRKRTAFEKCSRQVAFLGLLLGWSLLIGSRVWLHFTGGTRMPGSFEAFMLEMSWLLFSMAVLLGSIFYSLWRVLKNMPILHTTLGMLSAAQSCIALTCILFTIRVVSAMGNVGQPPLTLPELFPTGWWTPLWYAIGYTMPLLLAMPAAISACWLAFRRKADDYGRDYYNLMIPWCSIWARNAWSVLWLFTLVFSCISIWQTWESGGFGQQEAIQETGRVLFWLIPALLWWKVAQSKFPLRHTWMLFVAFVLAGAFMVPYFLELVTI